MKVHLAWIAARPGRGKEPALTKLANEFLDRARAYADIGVIEAADEEHLFKSVPRLAGRTQPHLVLLDSSGKQRSSEQIAELIGKARDHSVQHLVFAIGGANGWTAASLQRASEVLSLGTMTLPHELARLVLAEQIYRAFTILAGHPYHSGH
ncbi:MAG: 23S rRNA (pseudouridine(1915)-N(3))-methyltransferase RlmH [Acidobacteriaceae bacterium]